MPRIGRALGATLLAAALCPPSAVAQTAGTGIVEVAEPPVVDGRIDAGWAPVPALPLERSDGTVMGHVRLAHDSTALYVALTVPDDTVTFPNRSWRFGDGFYLTVLMPGTGTASDQHISLGLSRIGGVLQTVVVNRSGEYFPDHPLRGTRMAMHPNPEATPELSDGASAWDGELNYEVAVPWSVLAPAHPLVDSLAVNVVVVDRDGGTAREFAMLVTDPAFDTERTAVRRGRPLPLVRRRYEGEPRFRARIAAPVVATDSALRVMVAARLPEPGARPEWDDRTRTARVVLSRDGRTLASGERTLPPVPGIHRTVLTLPLAGAPTGPVTLRVELAGREVSDTIMLINPGGLADARRRLEASVPAGSPLAAAVPTALLRLERLGTLSGSAANAPVAPAAEAWDEFRRLAAELAAGSMASLLRSGRHELAHRSGVDSSVQPYSVHLPDGLQADASRPLLVVLHGSGVTESGTIRTVGPAAAERGWIVAAPRGRGLSDWYVGAAETDVLEVIDHVRTLYPVDPQRIVIAGFSMGGYGTWRMLIRHPARFQAGVVLAGAACPPESTDGSCVDVLLDGRDPAAPMPPVLVVHGARDNAVPVEAARRTVARLEAIGWPVEYVEMPDAAHGGIGWWARALGWLAHALQPATD